jgi:hypothetical protein
MGLPQQNLVSHFFEEKDGATSMCHVITGFLQTNVMYAYNITVSVVCKTRAKKLIEISGGKNENA